MNTLDGPSMTILWDSLRGPGIKTLTKTLWKSLWEGFVDRWNLLRVPCAWRSWKSPVLEVLACKLHSWKRILQEEVLASRSWISLLQRALREFLWNDPTWSCRRSLFVILWDSLRGPGMKWDEGPVEVIVRSFCQSASTLFGVSWRLILDFYTYAMRYEVDVATSWQLSVSDRLPRCEGRSRSLMRWQ